MNIGTVIDFIRGVFELTPVDAYRIPAQPRKRDVQPVNDGESRTTHDRVFEGKAYEQTVEQDSGAGFVIDWSTVDSKTGMSNMGKVKTLTAWDKGFLNEKFGDGKWNPTLAAVLKDHWANSVSAAAVEIKHRDKQSGKLEFGYSERNVKNYFWAFNRAWEKATEQKEKNK